MATSFETLGLGNLILMDGGMGSTLIDDFGQNIAGKPLWSAQVICDAPDAIVDAHLSFIRAGATIIKTVTYQCGSLAFQRAGINSDDATFYMLQAVELADKSRRQSAQPVRIALSLGPYGAQFGQEYTGYYPPPFGPGGPNCDGVKITNAFPPDERNQEEAAKAALAKFHYERLKIFASRPEIWAKIDCLAFETVPLLREAQAIQMAVSQLDDFLQQGQLPKKPWWLSFVLRDGQLPQDFRPSSRKITVPELVRGLCSPVGEGVIPDGVGVNCTDASNSIRTLKNLAYHFAQYSIPQPWLVLYPNGGHGYDLATRRWMERDVNDTEEAALLRWTEEIGDFSRSNQERAEGILVGGCCKCGPSYVQSLQMHLVNAT